MDLVNLSYNMAERYRRRGVNRQLLVLSSGSILEDKFLRAGHTCSIFQFSLPAPDASLVALTPSGTNNKASRTT